MKYFAIAFSLMKVYLVLVKSYGQCTFMSDEDICFFNTSEVKSMSRISMEQVKHVAHLARLAITEEEAEQFQHQLDQMISFAEELNELDTEQVVATSHVLDMKNVMREDVSKPGLSIEEVVKNAPDSEDGYIRVPAIID